MNEVISQQPISWTFITKLWNCVELRQNLFCGIKSFSVKKVEIFASKWLKRIQQDDSSYK